MAPCGGVSAAQGKPAGGWAITRSWAGTPTAAKGRMPPPTRGHSAPACRTAGFE